MKKLILISVFLVSIYCNAQKSIDQQKYFTLLEQGKYEELLVEVNKIRKEVYGKNCLVDYFIAKSMCGMGEQQNAVDWFNYIFKHYKLDDGNRRFLLSEMSSCNATHNNANSTSRLALTDKGYVNAAGLSALPRSSVSGKQGVVYNCKMPPQEVTQVKFISPEEMDSRLFSIDEGILAVQKYKSILSHNYNVAVSGRFIIISYGTSILNAQQVQRTAQKLEKVYTFFYSNYNLRPPDKLLAVYLLPDRAVLQQTARLVHGINIPEVNIGYSNISDLSLLGICDDKHIGTLCHELFHLMIRTDVGDVPPWMDEGMACIYETSSWQGDQLKGTILNWRTNVLKSAQNDMPEKIPTLRDFINYSYNQFDGFEKNDLCVAAINYAYGKHFMLYLQQQGLLTQLVSAMKNRNSINAGFNTAPKSDVNLLELALNKNIKEIEVEFDNWMDDTYHVSFTENNITFLEQWDGLAWQISLINNEPEKVEITKKYEELKARYDNLKPDPSKSQPLANSPEPTNEEGMGQVVAQPLFNSTIDEHTAAKERQLLGIKELKNELHEFRKEVEKANENSPTDNSTLNVTQSLNRVVDAETSFAPDTVLSKLTLHSRKDFNDKSGENIAYYYYLDGDNRWLDAIETVSYKRNHPSFHEYRDNSYVVSKKRDTRFTIKGYQYGWVETVFVKIKLKNQRESQQVLMAIVYDD